MECEEFTTKMTDELTKSNEASAASENESSHRESIDNPFKVSDNEVGQSNPTEAEVPSE